MAAGLSLHRRDPERTGGGISDDACVSVAVRAGHGPRCVRRGFTLFEVVVAIALVVVLGALGWVSLASLRETVSFEEGCAALVEGVDAARVMASARGVPHEVRAVVRMDRVEIQAAGLEAGLGSGPVAVRESGRETDVATDAAASARNGDAADGDAAGRERQWTTVVRVRGRFAMDDAATERTAGDRTAGERAAPVDASVATITLGLALPDGSMIAAVPLRVRDGRARWTTIRVGTWTTRAEPEVAASADTTEDENAAEEADGNAAAGAAEERGRREQSEQGAAGGEWGLAGGDEGGGVR